MNELFRTHLPNVLQQIAQKKPFHIDLMQLAEKLGSGMLPQEITDMKTNLLNFLIAEDSNGDFVLTTAGDTTTLRGVIKSF